MIRYGLSFFKKFEVSFHDHHSYFHTSLCLTAHPKVRVFITQGGLQSFQEAVHFGVPVVGIPWYGDQRFQVSRMVDAKIGARLLPKELHSFDKVKSVIESVLYEKR